MEQVVDLALPEYFERISAEATFQEQLSVIDIDNSRRSPVQVKNYPIRLKGYSLIFVLSGEITIGINYLSHTLKKNMVMQVYPDDIIEHTAYSADFKGYLIIHSAELKKEIMAMTSGIRLQQAGQLKKLHTRQELSEEESLRLRKQVELIKSYIPDKEHVYHSYVIKNQIINLFFDLDNCRWHRYGDVGTDAHHLPPGWYPATNTQEEYTAKSRRKEAAPRAMPPTRMPDDTRPHSLLPP